MSETVQKLYYSVEEAALAMSVCRRSIFHEIKAGRLSIKKMGKRTLIPAASIIGWPGRPAKTAGRRGR